MNKSSRSPCLNKANISANKGSINCYENSGRRWRLWQFAQSSWLWWSCVSLIDRCRRAQQERRRLWPGRKSRQETTGRELQPFTKDVVWGRDVHQRQVGPCYQHGGGGGGGWGTGKKRCWVDLTRKICLTGSGVIQNFNYCYYVRHF